MIFKSRFRNVPDARFRGCEYGVSKFLLILLNSSQEITHSPRNSKLLL